MSTEPNKPRSAQKYKQKQYNVAELVCEMLLSFRICHRSNRAQIQHIRSIPYVHTL